MSITRPQPLIRASCRAGSESLLTTRMSYGLRAGVLLTVLLMQILWLTVRFDTQSIGAVAGNWGQLFQFAPRLPQLVIAMVAAGCLMGRTRLLSYWREFSRQAEADETWRHWLFFQLISYVLLLVTSIWLFESTLLQTRLAGIIALEWLLLATSTGVCWLAAVAPLRCWRKLLVSESRYVTLGVLVGMGSLCFMPSAQSLWEPLSDLTLVIVVGMLSCCFADVVVDHVTRLVGTSTFYVEIAPQCSGYEGIGLIVVFLTAFCILFRHRLRFPQAWLLWPLGIMAIWWCNALRIALLIAVGTVFSPAVAMGGFHSQAGWIFFNLVALLLAGAALRIPYFTKSARAFVAPQTQPQVVWFLAPFLTLMALNLLVAAFSTTFDWGYPLKIIGTCLALACWGPRTGYRTLLRSEISGDDFPSWRIIDETRQISLSQASETDTASVVFPREAFRPTTHSHVSQHGQFVPATTKVLQVSRKPRVVRKLKTFAAQGRFQRAVSALKQYLPAALIGGLVFAIWAPLAGLNVDTRSATFPVELIRVPSILAVMWLGFRIFGSVVVIPLVEELAFRGYLLRRFVSDRFMTVTYCSCPRWTVIVSSLLFGLMHQAWIAGTLAGLAYAWAARRRNSLLDAVIAHAVTNGLIAAMVLVGDAWWLW